MPGPITTVRAQGKIRPQARSSSTPSPGATVVGVRRLAGPSVRGAQEKLDRGDLPDPMLRVISRMLDRQNRIEERLRAMEQAGLVPRKTPGGDRNLEERVRAALKEVIDPEVGIDLVDLGPIRGITVRDSSVLVEMVPTTATCPLVDYLTGPGPAPGRSR